MCVGGKCKRRSESAASTENLKYTWHELCTASIRIYNVCEVNYNINFVVLTVNSERSPIKYVCMYVSLTMYNIL